MDKATKEVIFSKAARLFVAAYLNEEIPHLHFSLRADSLQSSSKKLVRK